MSKSTTSQGHTSTAPASRVRTRGRLAVAAITAGAALSSMLSGCAAVGGETVTVNVGYQSKTINTVNAGTLMRDRGEFEKALSDAGKKSGTKYRVVWQDFSSGAPLTAAMIATHVDIGSMGDYPLLTNGSKTASTTTPRRSSSRPPDTTCAARSTRSSYRTRRRPRRWRT